MPAVVLAPNGQEVRWPAHIRRARRLAVGLAVGIRCPLSCARAPFLAWRGTVQTRQSPSRLMSIMRGSLSGLTISHLCLSALPRATKEVPTTAQTPLRRMIRDYDTAPAEP